MIKKIYWQDYDEPKKYSHTHKWTDKDGTEKSFTDSGEIKGEYLCRDKRVDRVWMTGGFWSKDESHLRYHLHFLFKDGSRKDFHSPPIPVTEGYDADPLFNEAEAFLLSNQNGDYQIQS